MSLAKEIFKALWDDGCILGSGDQWHEASLVLYKQSIINLIEDTLHASQGPNKEPIKQAIPCEYVDGEYQCFGRGEQPGSPGVRLPDPIT